MEGSFACAFTFLDHYSIQRRVFIVSHPLDGLIIFCRAITIAIQNAIGHFLHCVPVCKKNLARLALISLAQTARHYLTRALASKKVCVYVVRNSRSDIPLLQEERCWLC